MAHREILDRDSLRGRVYLWLCAAFGNDWSYGSMLLKLAKEAKEAAEAPSPDQLEELADCRICLAGAEAASGYTDAEISAAVEFKLAKNLRRKWAQQPDGTWQHVKEDK
jgi:hypothetical protein